MFSPLKKHALWATISVISLFILVLLFQKTFHAGWLGSSILDDGRPASYILADIQSLEMRIAEKNMQIITLENSLATNPHARESMEAEIAVLKAEVANLVSQVNDLQSVLDNRLIQSLKEAEEERILDEEIAALTREIEILTSEKNALESTIASHQTLLTQIEASIPALETAYETAKNAATPLEMEVASLQTTIVAIDTDIAGLRAEKQTLEVRVNTNLLKKKSTEEQIVTLKTVTIPGLTTIIANLSKEISTLTSSLASLTKALSTAEKVTLPKLLTDIAAKNTLISQTQAKLNAEKTKSTPSTKLIADYEATIKVAQTNRDTLLIQEIAVKKKMEENLAKKTELEGQKKAKELEKMDKSALLVQANTTLKALPGIISALVINMKNDQSAIAVLTTKITVTLPGLRAPSLQQLNAKNAELALLKANIVTSKRNLDIATSNLASSKTTLAQAQSQLVEITGKIWTKWQALAAAKVKKSIGTTTGWLIGGTTGGIQQTEICTNGIDDNGDGFKDCEDSQCSQDTACKGGVGEICDDREDNDGDQAVDCGDNECSELPVCRQGCSSNNSCVEICGNEIDDNNNGEADENCPKSCVLVIVQGINSDGSFTIDTSEYYVDLVNLGWTDDAYMMTSRMQTTLSSYYSNENKTEKILVAAHSLGAIAAFNAQSNFNSPDTTFHLYDAPYNYPGTHDISQFFSWILKAIVEARNNGIAGSLTWNWTNGLDQPDDPQEQKDHERYKFDDQALAPSRNWVENNCEPLN